MKTKKSPVSEGSYRGSFVLNEEIHANQAHTVEDSIKTVLKGKRDVGFTEVNKNFIGILQKHNIGILPIIGNSIRRENKGYTMQCIIYRNTPEAKKKALRLFEIVHENGGVLRDKTAEEAREIGQLLGYNNESINEYIYKHYISKLATEPDPNDFDDLHENKSDSVGLNKKVVEIIKDEEGNDVKICTVSGEFVKGTNPGLDFIQFVEGGHHYVDSYPGYKKHIPEDEIWVDEVFLQTPVNFKGIVGHEFKERNNMKYHKLSYDKAHDLSNAAEKKFRASKEKLKENYQFNKIKDLMKRII